MSDDETQARRGNPDKRTQRFSWTPAYEETFFRSLCESMQMGYKENHSFKSGAWERAAVALRDKHGACPEKTHLVNKADNARKRFRQWRGLVENPEFSYNPTTKTVTASEEAWKRHLERDPHARALRGRAFEHQEYMEVLFPDVLGSGGAPKRIMKSKRKESDVAPAKGDPPSTTVPEAVMPAVDPNLYAAPPPPLANAQQPSPLQAQVPQPAPVPTPAVAQPIQRPTSTTIPPRTAVVTSTSALTPPDEEAPNSANARKRAAEATVAQSEKRRGRPSRFSSGGYGNATPQAPPAAAAAAAAAGFATSPAPNAAASPVGRPPTAPSAASHGALLEEAVLSLAEVLRGRQSPRWSEQAVDIFFRDFADDDPDFQIKVAQQALNDENKAMTFAKMKPELRRHWIGRLRELHFRNLGTGRAGEEAP